MQHIRGSSSHFHAAQSAEADRHNPSIQLLKSRLCTNSTHRLFWRENIVVNSIRFQLPPERDPQNRLGSTSSNRLPEKRGSHNKSSYTQENKAPSRGKNMLIFRSRACAWHLKRPAPHTLALCEAGGNTHTSRDAHSHSWFCIAELKQEEAFLPSSN